MDENYEYAEASIVVKSFAPAGCSQMSFLEGDLFLVRYEPSISVALATTITTLKRKGWKGQSVCNEEPWIITAHWRLYLFSRLFEFDLVHKHTNQGPGKHSIIPHRLALSIRNLPCAQACHNKKHILRQQPTSTIIPPLLTPIRIPNRIQNPIEAPEEPNRRRRNWIRNPRNQQRALHSRHILEKVLMSALRAVEGIHGLCVCGRGRRDLLVGGVFVGVGDLGGFAEGGYAAAKPGADEEGADDGEEGPARCVC